MVSRQAFFDPDRDMVFQIILQDPGGRFKGVDLFLEFVHITGQYSGACAETQHFLSFYAKAPVCNSPVEFVRIDIPVFRIVFRGLSPIKRFARIYPVILNLRIRLPHNESIAFPSISPTSAPYISSPDALISLTSLIP